jgi:hypothetical protein
MDMLVIVPLDKTIYGGLPRLSIMTAIIVCMQMSDGGLIEQQATVSSFLFPTQHQLTLPEFLLILCNTFTQRSLVR